LPDSLQEALTELAEAQQQPISKTMVALLSEMEPQIRDLAKYARCFKAGRMDEAKQALIHMLGNNLADLLHDEAPTKTAKRGKS
jgi:hypothetical protein